MTPLQAEMLSTTMGLFASVIAIDLLDDPPENSIDYQEQVAREMTKAARSQLSSLKLIDKPPRPKQRPASAQTPKPPTAKKGANAKNDPTA